MNKFILILLTLIIINPPISYTLEPDEIISNSVFEKRARDLSKGIRWMVCQNQSIDDSDSDLAKDLRKIIREKIVQGETDSDITEFLVSKYGNFILMKPPLYNETYILWISPLLLMIIGISIIYYSFRRR